MKTILASALGTVATLALALPAAAQTINYGDLEQLFGEPVTASATGKPQRASDAPVNMEIITADDIRRSGAVNLPDVLMHVVGADVERWGMASADVGIRGYNSPRDPRLLVLVNGRQVYADNHGFTPWHSIPVELAEIRQIEVVKGPNTALFGFNAVGGVVNIVTYDPLTDNVNNVTARAGTQQYRELSAVTTLKLGDRAGLRLSAGGYNAEEFGTEVRPSERAYRSIDPKRRSVSADGRFKLTDDIQIGAEVTKIHTEQSEMTFGYQLFPSNYDILSTKASVTANTGLGLLQATVYRNQLDVNLASGIDYNNVVTVAQLQDLFKIGASHSFRLSAEYRHNALDSTPAHNGKVAYDVYSGGGMWDWAITDHLSLVNAARIDYLKLGRTGTFVGPAPFTNNDYDRSLSEFSFNSGLVYKLSDVDTVRLSAARGIQVPTMNELAAMGGFGTSWSYGNPNIDPSVVMNYEVGYDRAVEAIKGAVRASLYYQTNTDLKSASRVIRTGPTVTIYDNIGDSKAVGLETQVKGKIGSEWSWKLGYAYERIVDDLQAQTNYDFQDSTPRHKLSAELGYAIGRWEADLFAQYVSNIKMLRAGSTTPVSVPDNVTLSGRLAYKFTDNVQLALTGMNITHSEARLVSGPAEERRVFATVSASF